MTIPSLIFHGAGCNEDCSRDLGRRRPILKRRPILNMTSDLRKWAPLIRKYVYENHVLFEITKPIIAEDSTEDLLAEGSENSMRYTFAQSSREGLKKTQLFRVM